MTLTLFFQFYIIYALITVVLGILFGSFFKDPGLKNVVAQIEDQGVLASYVLLTIVFAPFITGVIFSTKLY